MAYNADVQSVTSIIFRREPTFAFWQPMSPPRKSSSSSGSGGLSKFGLVCAKYFHAPPQVSPSGPDQPLFLPILCGSASIQESIIFSPVITIIMYDMCGHQGWGLEDLLPEDHAPKGWGRFFNVSMKINFWPLLSATKREWSTTMSAVGLITSRRCHQVISR